MQFNNRLILKYLYEHDTGEFHVINDIIKSTSPGITEKEAASRLSYWINIDLLESFTNKYDYDDPKHIIHFAEKDKGNTFDNFEIKVRITAEGRVLYQKAYLEQDRDEKQDKIDGSVKRTNKFIVLTFVAISISAPLQFWSVKVMREEGEKNRAQLDSLSKKSPPLQPIMVTVTLSDSLQKVKTAK